MAAEARREAMVAEGDLAPIAEYPTLWRKWPQVQTRKEIARGDPPRFWDLHYPNPGPWPQNLRDRRLRFVSLGEHGDDYIERGGEIGLGWVGSKIPRRRGWLEEDIRGDDPRLPRARTVGNIGIKATNELAVVDIDDVKTLERLQRAGLLPKTFTVRTGSGGFHLYYWAEFLGRKIVFNAPPTADIPQNERHLGEVQCGDVYVVAPGSLHPNGKKYVIVDDIPIATLTPEDLDGFLEGLEVNGAIWDKTDSKRFTKQAKKTPKLVREGRGALADGPDDGANTDQGGHGHNLNNLIAHIPITAILETGSNPWHGSTTGNNLHVNPVTGEWYCFRCGIGGKIVEALYIEYKRAASNPEYTCAIHDHENIKREFRNFVPWAGNWAAERGFEFPSDDEIFPKRAARVTGPTIPASGFAAAFDAEFSDPETSQLFVWGVPRIGKTHLAMERLVEAGGGVSIAPTHNILAHMIRIFGERGGMGGVHLEGKTRSCSRKTKERWTNCDRCPLYPKTPGKMMDLQRYAEGLVGRGEICLTEKDINSKYCPHYALWEAAKKAEYVFTVPQLAKKICAEREIFDDDLLVIDEEGAARQFFARAVPVTSPRGKMVDDHLGSLSEHLAKLAEIIEIGERTSGVEKAVSGLVGQFAEVRGIIERIYALTPAQQKEGAEASLMADLRARLVKMQDSTTPEMRGAVIAYIEERSRGYRPGADEPSPGELIRAILYNYPEVPCGWVKTERGSVLYITGDEETPSEDLDWLREFPKRILLGGPMMGKLGGAIDPEGAKIRVSCQKYPQNYVVIEINGPSSDPSEPEEGRLGRDRKKAAFESEIVMRSLDHITEAEAGSSEGERILHGVGVLSGSRSGQADACGFVDGDRLLPVRRSSRLDLLGHWHSGYTPGLFANSTQARGVDVPEVNTSVVESLGFLTPYWTLRAQIPKPGDSAGRGEWEEWLSKVEPAHSERRAIVSDEAANLVLRTSPIHGHFEDQPKIIVIGGEDLAYVEDKFLEENIIRSSDGHSFTPESIATAIRGLGLTSRVTKNAKGWTTRSEIEASPEAVEAVRDGTIADLVRATLREEPHPDGEEEGKTARLLEYLTRRASWIDSLADIFKMTTDTVRRILVENREVLVHDSIGKMKVWTHRDNPNAAADIESTLAQRCRWREESTARGVEERLFELGMALADLRLGRGFELVDVMAIRMVRGMVKKSMIAEEIGGKGEKIYSFIPPSDGGSASPTEKTTPERPSWWVSGPVFRDGRGDWSALPGPVESFIYDILTGSGNEPDIRFSVDDVAGVLRLWMWRKRRAEEGGWQVPEIGRWGRNAARLAGEDLQGMLSGGLAVRVALMEWSGETPLSSVVGAGLIPRLLPRHTDLYALTDWFPEETCGEPSDGGGFRQSSPENEGGTYHDNFYGAETSLYGALHHKNYQPKLVSIDSHENPQKQIEKTESNLYTCSQPQKKLDNQPIKELVTMSVEVNPIFGFDDFPEIYDQTPGQTPPTTGEIAENRQFADLSPRPETPADELAGSHQSADLNPPAEIDDGTRQSADLSQKPYDYTGLPEYSQVHATDLRTWSPSVLNEARLVAAVIAHDGKEVTKQTIVATLQRIVERSPPPDIVKNTMWAVRAVTAAGSPVVDPDSALRLMAQRFGGLTYFLLEDELRCTMIKARGVISTLKANGWSEDARGRIHPPKEAR
jgi:hypothetical protein